MADETENIPWYASNKILIAILLAGFADLAWLFISGLLHEREHRRG